MRRKVGTGSVGAGRCCGHFVSHIGRPGATDGNLSVTSALGHQIAAVRQREGQILSAADPGYSTIIECQSRGTRRGCVGVW